MVRQNSIIIFLLTVLAMSAQAAHPHFTLPTDSFTEPRPLAAITEALDQKNDLAAATLLDALLDEDGDKLRTMDDGGLMSVATWIETLPANQKTALSAAYREKFDAGIREKVDLLRRDPDTNIETFYFLARRHPFSTTGAAAYALAADRLVVLGDLPAAHSLYQLAMHGGWIPDDTRTAQIDLLRKFDEGQWLAALPRETSSVTLPKTARPAVAFTGLIPFDALWFDRITAGGPSRFFPVTASDRVYFTSARSILAVKESGLVAWANSIPSTALTKLPTTAPTAVNRAQGNHRPANFTPAMLMDVYGRAQILIARQINPPSAEKENDYRLCAYRAADGKLLWNSDNQAFLKDLSFAGTPAICGRYTYAVALSSRLNIETAGDRNVDLILVALDTLTGDFRWQASLGRFKLTVEERNGWLNSAPWDGVWGQSEPLVASDAVCVSPNAGFTAAIGRFDGKLRWLRTYPKADPLPGDPALAARWRGTPVLCGNVLIIAPQDTAMAQGIDMATGRALWSTGKINVPTLVGHTATTAIFAGAAITAVDAHMGQPIWRWEPPHNSRITGPSVVNDGLVLVPTANTIVTLRAEDGTVAKDLVALTNLRHLFTIETAREAIEEAGMGKSFGLSPSP